MKNIPGILMPVLAFATLNLSLINSASAADEAAENKNTFMEEVVVTSRRIEESSQDVPIAISAFGEIDLERIAPRSLRDLDGLSPNVQIHRQTAGPGMGAIYIRGMGYQDVEKETPPPVGVIIDGLVLGTNTGQLIDMFDVEQVEINRGPQGVLFGKNTTGGTIVVKRVAPQFNEFHAAASLQFGDFGDQQVRARVNIPLIDDTLAVKIGFKDSSHDGFYENLTLGGDAGELDYQAYTVSALWEPTSTFSAQLTFDNLENRSDSVPMDARYDGDDPWITTNDWDAQTTYDQDMIGLQLEWDLGFGTLSSITGYIDSEDYVEQDFDSATLASVDLTATPPLPLPLAQLHTIRDQTYEQFTQEIRLSGNISDDVHYTVGAFFWEATITLAQHTNVIAQFANPIFPGGCAILSLPAHPVLGDEYCQTPYVPDSIGQLNMGPIAGLYSLQNFEEDIESRAIFGNLSWAASDQLELGLGFRFIDEEKDFYNSFSDQTFLGFLVTPAPAGFPVNQSNDWDDTILRFTANYMLNEDQRVYFSYAEGFRSGGFATRANNPTQTTYEPESVTAYELGWKADLLDGRLRMNVTAFQTEMDDQQISVVITDPFQVPGTNTVTNNADETTINGIELDLRAVLHDNFSVLFTYGYQNGAYDAFQVDASYVPVPPLGIAGTPGTLVTVPKKDPNRTPLNNWSLTGFYDKQMGSNRVWASLSLRDSDEYIISASPFGTDRYADPDMLIDIAFGMDWTLSNDDVLSVIVTGKNLGDEEYLDFMLPLGDSGGFQGWAPPQTYAVELRWVR